MKAYVDQDLCISCGLCTGIEPAVFFMNADGKAEAMASAMEKIDDGQENNVKQALEMCPVGAIQEA